MIPAFSLLSVIDLRPRNNTTEIKITVSNGTKILLISVSSILFEKKKRIGKAEKNKK